jgi:hypothetical protein
MYGFLADAIVAIHLVYVSSVIVGLLLILLGILFRWQWIRNPWFRLIHLAMILIVAFEAMIKFECPLTTWETQLRHAGGQVADDNISFVGRLLRSLLFYPEGSEDILTICYYAFAAVVLATFFVAPPRFRRRAPASAPGSIAPLPGPKATSG